MQGKKQRKRYRRLDRAERAAIQSGLDKGRSCRQMARNLGRSPSTVADEVARNRTVSKGPGKGERVRDAPEDACPRLLWIGYIFLDDFGRTKPAFLNSTGVMYPSVECILKLLYQCT